MKIIQVSAYYPPHMGGQEYLAQDLSAYLASEGHDVHVLTSTEGGKPTQSDGPVHVRRLKSMVFGHAPIMPAFVQTLLRLVRPGSLVHIHIGQAFTPEMVWLASKLRHFPYIAELHIDFTSSGPAGFLLPLYKRFVLKRVLQSAAVVVVLNEQTLRMVDRVYKVGHKARIMSNGIGEAYFGILRQARPAKPPKQLKLLFVGRFSKQKNICMLLEALSLTDKNVHLDIIGDGDQYAAVKEAIATYKLTNVTLHGKLSRPEVIPFYAASDALVMPSLYEAQPLVLLEAMAARIPIIGTNVIGIAEHIWDIGIVVEPTAAGIARGFDDFCASYGALPAMLQRGFEKAEALRWSKLGKAYIAMYESELAHAT